MNLLWTSDSMVEAMGGRPLGQPPEGVSGISIDTRTLRRGDAFFAIRGELHDGHDFATAAHVAGAGLLVVAEEKLPALGRLSIPMIVVPDVLAALEKLGAAARARAAAKIIAVTGSAGKTTTKEALRHALSAVGRVHASDKSFNNHWGVPLTLARMPADCDYAVFEIGMNHPGEIRPLTRLVRPHIAIVTLIAAAHLGHFKDLAEIARAKAEIFEGVAPGGAALLNRDDAHFVLLQKLARKAGIKKIRGFGEDLRSDYRLESCELGTAGSHVTVNVAGHEIEAEIGVPGRHMVQNMLAVLGAAHLAGAEVDKAAGALAGLPAERGRGMRLRLKHPKGEFSLIDESYNANPASMQAALKLLDGAAVEGGGRRIAVLGDMLELGAHSRELHSALAEVIAGTRTDMVLLAGKEMKALADSLPQGVRKQHRGNVEEIIPLLLKTVRPGDAVMVKSSNGLGFSRLVDALVRHYPAASRT
jgi:UDP-N-acetylmuramoyl-tripeptide--D-alanyl-D-alanine ligase